MPSITQQAALGVVGQLLAGLDRAYTGFGEVVDAVESGAAKGRQQLEDFKSFEFNPKWKTRVINVPAAISNGEELWNTIKELFTTKLAEITDDTKVILQAIHDIPPRVPGEPLLQRSALILEFVHTLNSRIAELVGKILDFTQTIDEIKKNIEQLDAIFLGANKRRVFGDYSYKKRLT